MYLEDIDDINIELEQVASIELDIKESGPPGEKGEPGLSAYEVYLNAGGTLSEVEWIESLKGETGKDGYTPVKGVDYWTEEDIQQIKTDLQEHFDNQLGVIENGSY